MGTTSVPFEGIFLHSARQKTKCFNFLPRVYDGRNTFMGLASPPHYHISWVLWIICVASPSPIITSLGCYGSYVVHPPPHYHISWCKYCSFRPDPLTNMVATGDSYFWLADLFNSSHVIKKLSDIHLLNWITHQSTSELVL